MQFLAIEVGTVHLQVEFMEKAGALVALFKFFLVADVVQNETPFFQGAVDCTLQVKGVDRLDQVIIDAKAQAGQGGVQIGIAGDDQNRGPGVLRDETVEGFKTAAVGEIQVQEDQGRFLFRQELIELSQACGDGHGQVLEV